ncbi:glycosyltransferase family 9 protein [Acidiferrimicrobium sp. IK]|uniref:glycosyltransferase family 9 protein n=1 Tax=Acidiferrimicrobium sp. IK TaxID=2871700 RepID=UPI0021CB962A|nr:glycosyltransferase family 9 protein [Acidiferrimicrobium sp. IK]MCU4183090.1 glycosyltransferase family 9 protein [Acidiferrimicrobium sp. IK]
MSAGNRLGEVPPVRLVVLRALNLGDILTGLPALRALRRAFPLHHMTVAAPSAYGSLLRREVGIDDLSDSHELAPLDPALAGPDVAVDLHGRGPGSQPLLLALSPRRLVAFAHPDIPDTAGMPEWRPGEHEVVRWCRLLQECAIPASPDRLELGPAPVTAPACARDATVIHPGAAAPARRWPPRRWAEVVRAEVGAGRRVVLTGSAGEAAVAATIAAAAPGAAVCNLAGRTDLDELIAVVRSAGRVISGDTGVAHLAFATATPSVTLYGPVPPAEWGPPPGRPWHVALWKGQRGDPHASRLDPGLAAITAGDVITAGRLLDARLASSSRPSPTVTSGAAP